MLPSHLNPASPRLDELVYDGPKWLNEVIWSSFIVAKPSRHKLGHIEPKRGARHFVLRQKIPHLLRAVEIREPLHLELPGLTV